LSAQELIFQNAVAIVTHSVILSQINLSRERYKASCRQSVGIIEVTEATLMKWFHVTAIPPQTTPHHHSPDNFHYCVHTSQSVMSTANANVLYFSI